MKDKTHSLPLDMPVYADDLAKAQAKKKIKAYSNVFSEQLNRLMTYFGKTAQDIHEKTGVAHPTLSDWINNKVEVQMTDDNLPLVVSFFDPDITIDFVVYAIPKTDRDKELDDRMPDLDERTEYVNHDEAV